MADLVVSAFFSLFFDTLASKAFEKIARAKGIKSELEKLKTSLDQIQNLLNDASQKEIANKNVKRWLDDLQHLAYDIDDVLDELATEAMHRELAEESGASTSSLVRKLIPTCCTNFSLSTRMHGKLDDITTRLQELVEKNNILGLSVNVTTNEKPKISRSDGRVDEIGVVGREGDKKALIQKLLWGKDESCSQNFSVVPIVGMGGVGKTTLAKLLYEEKEVKEHFEFRAWVCVSDEFDIFNICKVIYENVTGENKKFEDLNLLQDALKEKLKNKLFLIVLDDVWSEKYSDWQKLVGMFLVGAPGSKIIMTTRKEQLLTQIGYGHLKPLQSLLHDDALSLFAQHALGVNNFDSLPTLRPLAEGLVKKCDGLPLALKTLGRLLRLERDERKWKELLKSEIWTLDKRDEIVPALRLSYNELEATLKQLFAYCSLFPKDYVFDKEELILLWMAEGFLHQSTTSKSMERLGHENFEELLSRSFFQHAPNDKSLFVMHDLMNDLARSVAGEFFSRSDIETKKEAFEKHRHMSFVCEEYMAYKRFEPFKGAKSMRTFLALSVGVIQSWKYFYVSNKVLDDLLHELPLLRVLNLSHLKISDVPESIGRLKQLRYLNLSHTAITHLPHNVCNLYNLQTLIVSRCDSLEKLPESFSKLKKLRHFDMRDTPHLKKMPLGILELKSLQTLYGLVIEVDKGFSITKLKDLKELQGEISIKGLEKVHSSMNAQEANLSEKRLSGLEVEWSNEFGGSRKETIEKEVLNVLKPNSGTLKKLGIGSYGGTEFPNWIGDPSFGQLTRVSIRGCKKCTSLPPLGQLPLLKELVVAGMDEVKVVGPELLGTGVAFPSLEILNFEDIEGWQEWSTNNSGVDDTSFPCLQELRIKRCPNLVRVSIKALPSLRVLKLRECSHGVLTSLVHVASSLTKLDIEYISGLTEEAWRGVIQYLRDVEEISIWNCDEIRYLWESEAEASKYLVNLRNLEVWNCSKLVSLGEKEEEDNCGTNLTSLTSLDVSGCESLERCRCPGSVEKMRIGGCDSITSVSFPAGGGQKLKSVGINHCKKLLEEELGRGEKTGVLINSSMRMLEVVDIYDWPNLKSITALGCFVNLTRLEIGGCRGMESFPDHELPNLNSLTYMRIVNCTSLDDSFPRGLWPPNLCELAIGGLKKPISEWGPQKFPISLVDLTLWGGPCADDVRNFGQLSHLLPSSLTSLLIRSFEKVESVSMGLQHLTSLQHLAILCCPKTMDLPELLMPSLLSLRILECPNLKERCSRRGSYWPRISRIPRIDIR